MIEPVTFWLMGECSNQLSHTGHGICSFFNTLWPASSPFAPPEVQLHGQEKPCAACCPEMGHLACLSASHGSPPDLAQPLPSPACALRHRDLEPTFLPTAPEGFTSHFNQPSLQALLPTFILPEPLLPPLLQPSLSSSLRLLREP